MDVLKRKTMEKDKTQTVNDKIDNQALYEASPEPKMEIDLEAKIWARSKKAKSSNQNESSKEIDYTQSVEYLLYNKTVDKGMNVSFSRLRFVYELKP